MNTKKLIWIAAVLTVLGLLIASYLYFFQKPEKKGVVNTTQKLSESVPTIATNPANKVPEINPLDRANPFKYVNPLR